MNTTPTASSSFWLADTFNRNIQSTPQLPITTEAVVIGGGISGVSVAYWLSQFGIEVTLLEQQGLAGGATGRNGGHLAVGSNKDFPGAIATHGQEEALSIWHFTQEVVGLLHQFIENHQVDCDLQFNSFAILAQSLLELEQQQHAFEVTYSRRWSTRQRGLLSSLARYSGGL